MQRNFQQGAEFGSARCGTAKDIEPYVAPVFENNVLLIATERLMMSGRARQPNYARNKNVVVISGSGLGKTRFFCKTKSDANAFNLCGHRSEWKSCI